MDKLEMELRLFTILLFSAAGLTNAQIWTSRISIKQVEPCSYECTTKFLNSPSKNTISCCMRGCRFFYLGDFNNYKDDYSNSNGSKSLESCEASCKEAYGIGLNLLSCLTGCSTMARETSPFTIMKADIRVNEDSHPDSIIISPDGPDSDIFTDSSVGKEVISWWDFNDFKLPESHLKTIPINSEQTIDYEGPLEYSKDNEKPGTTGSDWLQCASKHTGVPKWLLIFAICSLSLSATWLCLSPDKSEPVNNILSNTTLIPSNTGKVMVYLPPESPLHKKPPPKYSEVVNISALSLDV